MNIIAIAVATLLMLIGVPLLGALIVAAIGASGWFALKDRSKSLPENDTQ